MCGGNDANIPSDGSSSRGPIPVPLVFEMSRDIKELKLKVELIKTAALWSAVEANAH